jgi:tetratricopeptide (TPR) repeat protein
MNETELKGLLQTLHRQLNILKEREAKFGGDAPLRLLNQIEDHQTALKLVEARLRDDISADELEESLAPLNLSLDRRGDTEIVSGRNIIKIGTLVIPTVPLVALLVVVVGVLAFLGWNFIGPAKMEGRFNVAVAEFGQIDEGQNVQRSQVGGLFSKWVFDDLQAENEAYPASSRVEMWHDSLPLTQKRTTIGIVPGATPDKRANAANELAQKINADVVLYGHLALDKNPADFLLEFYVSPRLRPEAGTTIGRYQLGDPIRVPRNFDPEDALSRETVAGPLATRSNALFWLLLGLREELLGRSEQALKIFRQAEEQLASLEDEDGKDVLYFFIGQSELFLNNDVEAQQALEKALAINPQFARARTALGSVYFKRAQCRLFDMANQKTESASLVCQRKDESWIAGCELSPDQCQGLVEEDIEQTIDYYQQGLDLAEKYESQLAIHVARLAVSGGYILAGQIYARSGDDDEASRHFESAIAELQAILEPLAQAEQYRFLGQAYQALGTAYAQQAVTLQNQGDLKGSIGLFEKAQAAFGLCIEQAENAPYADEILVGQVVAGCKSYYKVAEEALLNLEGVQ